MSAKRADFVRKLQDCERSIMFEIRFAGGALSWTAQIALDYFRNWLVEQVNAGQGSSLTLGYASLYHNIGTWGSGMGDMRAIYTALPNFVNMFSQNTSPEASGQINQTLHGILVTALQYVQPLMEDKTKRKDRTRDINRNLLCMGIEDDELPWVKK